MPTIYVLIEYISTFTLYDVFLTEIGVKIIESIDTHICKLLT